MKPTTSLAFVVALVFASNAVAQNCSTLAVSGGQAGTNLMIKVTGADENSLCFLALSDAVGTTTMSFGPLGSLELGLASPVISLPIGGTDGNGDLTLDIPIPSGLPAFEFKGQAVTGGLTITRTTGQRPSVKFEFCTSNVTDVKVGGS